MLLFTGKFPFLGGHESCKRGVGLTRKEKVLQPPLSSSTISNMARYENSPISDMPFPMFSVTAIPSFLCLTWEREKGGVGGDGGGGGVGLKKYIPWSPR